MAGARGGLTKWLTIGVATVVVGGGVAVWLRKGDGSSPAPPARVVRIDGVGGEVAVLNDQFHVDTEYDLPPGQQIVGVSNNRYALLTSSDDLTIVDLRDGTTTELDVSYERLGWTVGRTFVVSSITDKSTTLVDVTDGSVVELADRLGVEKAIGTSPIVSDGVVRIADDLSRTALFFAVDDPDDFWVIDDSLPGFRGEVSLSVTPDSEPQATMFRKDHQVGAPVALDGKVRAVLGVDGESATLLLDDGSIRRADFSNGAATDLGSLGYVPEGVVSTGDRSVVVTSESAAILDSDGSVLGTFVAADFDAESMSLADGAEACAWLRTDGTYRFVVLDTRAVKAVPYTGAVIQIGDSGCALASVGVESTSWVDGVEVDGQITSISLDRSKVVLVRDGDWLVHDLATGDETVVAVDDRTNFHLFVE